MRAFVLSLLLLSACSSSLRLGDRAFGEARYEDAARAYAQVPPADADAVMFRVALLYSISGSPKYDPAKARQTLDELTRVFPASPYGVAARVVLDRLKEQEEVEGRLRAVNDELAQEKTALARMETQRQDEVKAQQDAVAKLQTQMDQLTAQLKQLKDEHAELVLLRNEHAGTEQLRAENAHLQEELDELKRIDLRK